MPKGFDARPPMRDGRIWRLGIGSGLFVMAQAAIIGFVVLFLVDEHGMSPAEAAMVLAAIQVASAVVRIWVGRWSDRTERRIVPLRHAGLSGAALVALAALLAGAPNVVLVPLLVAGGAAMSSWNGLAFTAAAEIAGRARAGTAMSLQNTLVSVLGIVASPLFGFLVEATSYQLAYLSIVAAPLAGWWVLRPLESEEERRVEARRTAPRRVRCNTMSTTVDTSGVQSGLEGVVAFATEIAEPDKEGGSLRYRGVDIEDLVGQVPYEQVWGLLVDGSLQPGLPPAEPHPLAVRSGDPRVDVQSALAMLAPEWGFKALIDISDEEAREQLARASVMALSFVAQSARGVGQPPVPQKEVDKGRSIPERFLIRWRGEADPDHVKAIDAYWNSAAEHGMNASTFTARVVASTGADAAAALSSAVGALSGPLHGGAPSRVLKMLDDLEQRGRRREVRQGPPRPRRAAHGLRPPRLPRRGSARPRPAAHRAGDRLAPLRGRRGARERRARRAQGPQARPRPGHERRVLVGGRARHRRGPGRPVHVDVHLRARRRLVGAHPRAEARGAAHPPDGEVRRRGPAPGLRGLRACRLERPAEDVAQHARVLLGQRGERLGREAEPLPHPVAQLDARGRDRDHLHAPVALARRRSTRPRASSRSTMPVTFELSQRRRVASSDIGLGVSGSSAMRAPTSARARGRAARRSRAMRPALAQQDAAGAGCQASAARRLSCGGHRRA